MLYGALQYECARNVHPSIPGQGACRRGMEGQHPLPPAHASIAPSEPQLGHKIVFSPGEEGVLLVSPVFRSRSRSRELFNCCALPSDRSTLPFAR